MLNLQRLATNRTELAEGKHTFKIAKIEIRTTKAGDKLGVISGMVGEKPVDCIYSTIQASNGNTFFENALTDCLNAYGMNKAIEDLAIVGLDATEENIGTLLQGLELPVYVVRTTKQETGEVYTNYYFSVTSEVRAMLKAQ